MNDTKITIHDVAQKANVSIATVSRVFNNTGSVKKRTAARVLDAARELKYLPDTDFMHDIACNPVSAQVSRLKTILLFLPSVFNPFYGPIIEGIYSSAENNKLQCLVQFSNIADYNIDALKELLTATNTVGIIVFTIMEEEMMEELVKILPVVQCCESNDNKAISSVSIDDTSSSLTAMEHIISTGRTKISLIHGPLTYKYARRRRAGYLKAMENAHLNVEPNWLIQIPDNDVDMVYSSVIQELSAPNAPDAFFATSDLFAAAAIRAIKHVNMRVPEDIIVVGFDDIDYAKLNTPSISSVCQPKFRMGYIACELLADKIANPETPTKHIKLETKLVIRESSYSQFSKV